MDANVKHIYCMLLSKDIDCYCLGCYESDILYGNNLIQTIIKEKKMKISRFVITEEHIKLIKRAYTGWNDCEFTSPGMNCKRPFGNSDVFMDMAEILGISPINDYGEYSTKDIDYMLKLYEELEIVLQIMFRTLQLTTGTYETEQYMQEWKKVK